MELSKETLQSFIELFQEALNDKQNSKDQYVVVYKKVSDDTVIGYHADSFCTMRQNLLEGKRYSGENPYPQLSIIAKNFKYAMTKPHYVEVFVPDLEPEDIYIDAIYLAEGIPKQNYKVKIL